MPGDAPGLVAVAGGGLSGRVRGGGGDGAMSADVRLTDGERDALWGACDAGMQFGDAWLRFIRNGQESMLLPEVEAIIADRVAAERERIAEAIEARRRELVRTSVGPSRQTPWERATSTALSEAQGITRNGGSD